MLASKAILIVEFISTCFVSLAFVAGISNAASIAPVLERISPAEGFSKNANTVDVNATEPAIDDYIISQSPIKGKSVHATFSAAIAAIQKVSSTKAVTVFVYPGTYKEQIVFNRSGTTIFRGYTEDTSSNKHNQVTLQNSHGVDTQADQSNSDSATLYSRASDIQLYNINLNNIFGQTRNFASLGFAIGNNGRAAFYGCQVTGNQDTFDTNAGTSVFAYNTLIEGSVDFIWGAGSVYLLNSTIVPNTKGGYIAAMKRASASSPGGLVFDQSTIAAAANTAAGSVFLGRPYSQYSRVAYIKTYLDGSIAPAGWSVWSKTDPRTDGALLGEYQNYGPGADTKARASFSRQLSNTDVAQFRLSSFFSSQGTSWIDMTHVKTTPFSL
ncbi:carbohydrate esterase family 8 protein [Daldinia decipiens]|uniref:carbohydrate esterase family 8 protein n=1 Tax=Daldinia decipiens TaxID=326647 RepID=UPI0020C4F60E|nr:carbohydrate esterase family 8 protein [Daldinia decipiens]KAI1662089.1 carbohydrate esterase family 8 protein [Daldinia decipiens]